MAMFFLQLFVAIYQVLRFVLNLSICQRLVCNKNLWQQEEHNKIKSPSSILLGALSFIWYPFKIILVLYSTSTIQWIFMLCTVWNYINTFPISFSHPLWTHFLITFHSTDLPLVHHFSWLSPTWLTSARASFGASQWPARIPCWGRWCL